MANEYLRRNFTSTGNLKVGTFSFWMKGRPYDTNQTRPVYLYDGSTLFQVLFERTSGTNPGQILVYTGSLDVRYKGVYRDPSAWSHYLIKVDNTTNGAEARFEVYVNGVKLEIVGSQTTSTASYPARDVNIFNNVFYINGTGNGAFQCCDYFFIDGQALTPDVFGFYKQGKGYISVGSTQATDFRPGQWVPKTPRVIKTEIIRRGGFGVNGFYLPMNDSNNFGADFHGEPNSIITLNEKLPQPRVGVATTASVGLGYTDALRADPYAANLVLALPFVSGGLNSGFGDYAPSIKGSGSAKSLTNTTAVSIATTAGYYGTAANFGGSHYLTASYNSDFNFGTGDFTVEMWVYPTAVSDIRGLFAVSGGSGGNPKMAFHLNSGTPSVHYNGLTNASDIYTAASSAIPANQWTHLAYVRKGTTWTWFANGVATGTGSNTTVITFTSQPYYIGYGGEGYFAVFNGYIQDLRVYKGVAKYTGGFDVPKPYTPVGIATWRAVPDTTANNFATLNPLITRVASGTAYPLTFTDGNLTATANSTADSGNSCGIAVTSGKWYAEYRINTNNTSGSYKFSISVNPADKHWGIGNGGDQTGSIHFRPANAQLSSVSGVTFSTIYTLNYTIAIGDIIGVSLDMDNRQVSFYKNGTLITQSGGAAAFPYSFSGTNSTSPYGFGLDIQGTGANQLTLNFGQNPTFSGNTTAGTFTDSNGKGLFKYQPPSGFLALCEDNLPTPAISDPGKYFKSVLYTGDGNSGRSIVGIGFTPDLVWGKSRTNTAFPFIVDSIRGPGNRLFTNDTQGDNFSASSITSFDSDGFSMGSLATNNASSQNYVAWCWRAGAGTTSTNTNGTINSVVSVNQDAGFSIVSYTGNSTSGATVGHGLGKAPSMVIVKARDAARGWNVYHQSLGNTKYIQLSSTAAAVTNSAWWNNTSPNSSTFTLGNDNDVNGSGIGRYIAYCWAEIEGFSKFGSYVGNGNADGSFVYTGHRPAFVMIKRTAGAADWVIHDSSRTSTNPSDTILRPNTSDIDLTASTLNIDFLSNGFKIRNANGSYNNSELYIFASFAESPFSYSNAK